MKYWYNTLRKAPWTPPNWVFGIVWTFLYAFMGGGGRGVAGGEYS